MTSSAFTRTTSSVLTAAAIACGVAILAHCGMSDAGSTAVFADGGASGDPGLGGSYDDAGPSTYPLLPVNASPGLFAFRVCLSTSQYSYFSFRFNAVPWPYADTADGSASRAAIAVGSGAQVPLEILPDVYVGGSSPLNVFLIDAHALAASANPSATCEDLFGYGCPGKPSCLAPSNYLHTVAPQSWGAGPMVVAIVGCPSPGPGCGATRGPLAKLVFLPYVWTAPQTNQISVALAHASVTTGAVVATLDSSDAGAIPLDEVNHLEGPDHGALVTLPALPSSPEWETQGIAIQIADAGLRMSLADLQRVSDPSSTPASFFKAGAFYAFVLTGDQGAANPLYVDGGINPAFDGTALHFVAIQVVR